MSPQDQTVAKPTHDHDGHDHDDHDHDDHDHDDHDGGGDDLRVVVVFNSKTNETARFAVPGRLTLERVWQMAYDELGEMRGENDIFETRAGEALTEHLGQSVKHIAEHIDSCLEFQIHGEQGGA